MRLHVLSDLHIEFQEFTPDPVEADVIICGGDVHVGKNGIRFLQKAFPSRPVIYVLGNHEFYGQKIPKLIEELKQLTTGTNVMLLENNSVEIDGLTFLGATLWTDFALYGDVRSAQMDAQASMTDFRRIRVNPTYRRFKPSDAGLRFARTIEWMTKEIERLQKKPFVMVTHHAPSPRSIPESLRGNKLNPAYVSNLDPFVELSGASLWIHGHIHLAQDYRIGNTRVVANPRGYPDEKSTGFRSDLVVEV